MTTTSSRPWTVTCCGPLLFCASHDLAEPGTWLPATATAPGARGVTVAVAVPLGEGLFPRLVAYWPDYLNRSEDDRRT